MWELQYFCHPIAWILGTKYLVAMKNKILRSL